MEAETEMDAQSAAAGDGFTPVARRGARRAKKRRAEQLSAAGEGADAGRMDTEEARPAKRPVFPPLAGDGVLVLAGTARRGRGLRVLPELRGCSRGKSLRFC